MSSNAYVRQSAALYATDNSINMMNLAMKYNMQYDVIGESVCRD